MVLGYAFEPSHLAILATLILLEGVLSFDNAAVLAAMVRKLPPEQRSKALYYGLAGAYAMRIAAIFGAAFLIRYPVIKLIGGTYLLYLAAKHLFFEPHKEHVEHTMLSRLGISPFWSVVISLELADLVFAVDQVIVAVALTDELLLIIIASLFAIAFLRLSASYLARLMGWFPALEKLAYIAVGFVGLKLVLVDVAHRLGYTAFDIPKEISITVTLSLLVLPVIGKLIWDRFQPRDRPA